MLRLENRDPAQLIAYKVKTTAVKRYVVRPNVGVLLPGKAVDVAVVHNYERARAEGVELSEVHDRFQVLSVAVEIPEHLPEVWSKTPEEAITKTMVKSKFVAPHLVKTVTPNSPATAGVRSSGGRTSGAAAAGGSGGGGAMSGNSNHGISPEPDMEQAKTLFKAGMASVKAKSEAKTLRAERDAALQAVSQKDEQLAKLRQEVAQLRSMGGAAAGNGGKRSVMARASSFLLFTMLYVMVLVAFFVMCYKVFDYDPLYSISRDYSLTLVERRFKLYLLNSLK